MKQWFMVGRLHLIEPRGLRKSRRNHRAGSEMEHGAGILPPDPAPLDDTPSRSTESGINEFGACFGFVHRDWALRSEYRPVFLLPIFSTSPASSSGRS